jgi:hypothetical protein
LTKQQNRDKSNVWTYRHPSTVKLNPNELAAEGKADDAKAAHYQSLEQFSGWYHGDQPHNSPRNKREVATGMP